MSKYVVHIHEHLAKNVLVEAENVQGAIEIVRQAHEDSDIILVPDDFTHVTFEGWLADCQDERLTEVYEPER